MAVINFEKEEQWLNNMAAKGLNFISCKFARYTFEEGPTAEYIYRLELLKGALTDEQVENYLTTMESNVCISTITGHFFGKKQLMDLLKFIRILNLELITTRESLIY